MIRIDWKIHDRIRPSSLPARLSEASVARHSPIATGSKASTLLSSNRTPC
jgi:hypothetical protein